MPTSMRKWLGWSGMLLVCALELRAQLPDSNDPPAPLKPLRAPTQQELDRREALKLYGLGLLQQREDRLLEAVRTFEEAIQLDPASAPLQKTLIPLYLALGRSEAALTTCRKTLELDTGDHETWYLYARQLKDQGRPQDAVTALARGVACASLKEHPDLLIQMQYDLGSWHEEAKEFHQAEAAFRKVVEVLDRPEGLLEQGPYERSQLEGEAAKTWERIGQICIRTRSYARAVEAFLKAQDLFVRKLKDPVRASRINANLAELYVAQKNYRDALTHLERYLPTQPQGASAYESWLTIMRELGRQRESIAGLEQFARRDAHNVPLQLLLAQQYAAAGRWQEAESLYQRELAKTPAPDVYRGLFQLYQHQALMGRVVTLLDETMTAAKKENRPDEAAAGATRARSMLAVLRDDPELVKALLPVVRMDLRSRRERTHDTWRFLAVLVARTRNLEDAELLYRQCLQTITPQTEHEVYGGLLEVLWQAHKRDEVVRICRRGLEEAQATSRVLFHVNLALALSQLGKTDEALAEADAAVNLADDRNRLRLRRIRADVLRQAEKYDQAIAECQALFKEFAQPGEVRDIRYTLSNIYSSARDHAKAEEQLRQILELDPNDATANNDLGYIMADQGKNLEESERLIRKAIDLDRENKKTGAEVRIDDDKDNPAFLDSLGWVLFRRGRHDEARGWLEKASALPGGGDDPVVWDHLGDVYVRLNQPERAREAWLKAGQLYETEKRRKTDDRSKELKNKLQLLKLDQRR